MNRELTLDVETVSIRDLIPADYNPRKSLTLKERMALRRSIKEYGMVYPLVVNKRNNVVVGGHQRLQELEDMGIDEVPVVWVDMDEEQERRANIQLNAIEADFDVEKLQELVHPMMPNDIEDLGFTATEARALLSGIFVNNSQKEALKESLEEGSEDSPHNEEVEDSGETIFTCPQCGYKGTDDEFYLRGTSTETDEVAVS